MPPSDSTSVSAPATATAPGQQESFVRLPGRATTLRLRAQGTVTLYLAETYLLQVQVLRLRENYLKFGYKDIQAIEICRTVRGVAYSVSLLVITVLFLLGVLAVDEREGKYAFGAFAGFFAVLLVVELIRGTTCRCMVQTATGKHQLHSLVRMKQARRALELISARIVAVQGTLDQATASLRMEEFLYSNSSRHAQRAVAPAPAPAVIAPTPGGPTVS